MLQEVTKEASARERGYTQAIMASGGCYDLELLIKPDTDLDDRFTAFDVDNGEYLAINGWLFSFES